MKKFTAFIALLFMVLMVAAPAGAVTFTKLSEALMGNLRAVVYKVTFDSAYPSGGEDISRITTSNFSTVLQVQPDIMSNGFIPAYDYANDKIIVYVSSTAAGMQEVSTTPGDALSGTATRVLVIGW